MKKWCENLRAFVLTRENGRISRNGADNAGVALMLFRSSLATDAPLVAAVPEALLADRLQQELELLSHLTGCPRKILLLPECGRGKLLFPGGEMRRARALNRLLTENFDVILGSMHALLGPAPAPAETASSQLELHTGMTLPMQELLARLVKLDYDDEQEVSVSGEFAKRGGIVDFYSPAHDFPCRVEFFGDEICSLRGFDPETQRSTGEIAEYRLINRAGITAGGAADADAFDYLGEKPFCLLDIFPESGRERLERYSVPGAVERFEAVTEKKKQEKAFWFFTDLPAADSLPADAGGGALDNAGELPEDVRAAGAKIVRKQLENRLKLLTETGGTAVLLAEAPEDLPALQAWCREQRLALPGVEFDAADFRECVQIKSPYTLIVPESDLAAAGYRRAVTEEEPPATSAGAVPEAFPAESPAVEFSLSDFEEGDYVVHLDYGIGIFRGIRILETGDSKREVLTVEYRDEQLLYVPMRDAGKLSRYLGAAVNVKLHALDGTRWSKDKLSAGAGVRSYAADMLRFQAMRQAVPGIVFRDDRRANAAFLRGFPFKDTPDQKRTTAELRHDMMLPKPMDRLLCGDVGYGKTEMAMRAAFRAVSSGYQVAVIAPTTVLAQQHYRSFCERFAEYPFTIDVVSRFRTAGEQRRIMERLQSGGIDILIGTHRLCSREFQFRNLGLVIIDEEQRFGVEHKERLRRFRAEADVLSMSATPIPRTLYMAMAGARDLSTLMTPPKLRLPVKTVIAPEDDALIAAAIKAELARGGQVYYLHNRVCSIEQCAERLQAMLPGTRLQVAHGQMSEHHLEEVMTGFLEGRTDVLVCSTIIESGLDVPNANTIIIEHADRFGLAELYQLRGRVGRWKHQAYAYLLLPKNQLIGTNARKRLNAIRKCATLGSGFQLALRDLEIRGSGNLLGAEQSGHLNLIGFDLYCQLLKQEVARMKGEKITPPREVEFGVDFISFALKAPPGCLAAAFPPEYIAEERLRISAYRRLASLHDEIAVDDYQEELTDRFGKLPKEALTLLETVRLQLLAERAGYRKFTVVNGMVSLSNPGEMVYRKGGKVPLLDPRDPPQLRLRQLRELLLQISAAAQ